MCLYMLMNIFDAYVCIYANLWIYVNEIIEGNDTREERKKLGVFYYYNVFTLPVEQYSVIWKWAWISYKCISQTLGKYTQKNQKIKKYNRYIKKGDIEESYEMFNKKYKTQKKERKTKIRTKATNWKQ